MVTTMRQRVYLLHLSAAIPLLAGLLAATPLVAEPATGEPEVVVMAVPTMTMQGVIANALQRDPNAALADAYQTEARYLERYASSLVAGNPVASLHYQSDQMRRDQGMREWEGSLEFPLWHFGQRSASRDIAEWAQQAAASSAQVQRLMVAGAVRESLWDLAMAEERRALAEQSWQTAQRLEQDVAKRVSLGDLAKSDLLLAQDETLAKQDDFLAAEAEWQHGQKRYVMLTGLQQRPAHFSETLAPQTEIDERHPLLAEMRARMERARTELRRAEQTSSDNTQLVIGTRRTRDLYTSDYVDSMGIGVRIPLGTATHNGPRIAAASVGFAESQSFWLRTQRELALALHEAHHTLETLREQIKLAEEQNQLSQESLRMAQVAFRSGEIELAQLLRIQARAFIAERNFALRKLEVDQAIARYNQAVGVTP